MVKSNVVKKDNTKQNPPDIFRAAAADDPYELTLALQAGQSLNDIDHTHMRTPLHVAAFNGSVNFLRAAAQHEGANAWHLDCNDEMAYDLAAKRKDREAMKIFFGMMYPNGLD